MFFFLPMFQLSSICAFSQILPYFLVFSLYLPTHLDLVWRRSFPFLFRPLITSHLISLWLRVFPSSSSFWPLVVIPSLFAVRPPPFCLFTHSFFICHSAALYLFFLSSCIYGLFSGFVLATWLPTFLRWFFLPCSAPSNAWLWLSVNVVCNFSGSLASSLFWFFLLFLIPVDHRLWGSFIFHSPYTAVVFPSSCSVGEERSPVTVRVCRSDSSIASSRNPFIFDPLLLAAFSFNGPSPFLVSFRLFMFPKNFFLSSLFFVSSLTLNAISFSFWSFLLTFLIFLVFLLFRRRQKRNPHPAHKRFLRSKRKRSLLMLHSVATFTVELKWRICLIWVKMNYWSFLMRALADDFCVDWNLVSTSARFLPPLVSCSSSVSIPFSLSCCFSFPGPRRLSSIYWSGHIELIKRLRKAKKIATEDGKPACINTHLRDMIIIPEMVASIVGIHNGKEFTQVEIKVCLFCLLATVGSLSNDLFEWRTDDEITFAPLFEVTWDSPWFSLRALIYLVILIILSIAQPDMIGHYLGEFSMSYKPVRHGRPGMLLLCHSIALLAPFAFPSTGMIFVLFDWLAFSFCSGSLISIHKNYMSNYMYNKTPLYELISPAHAVHITEPSSYNCFCLRSDASSMNKQASCSTQMSIVTQYVPSLQSDHLLIRVHHITDDLM